MGAVRRIARATEEVVLTVLSILGALCLVLVVLALVFDVTLIMFKTGSMSPTIPAGSVAVVRKIPASAVKVGDVVTVDRAGQLPVTHRVTSVRPGPAPDQRVLTLKGDANEAEDAAPYTVSTVRITLASVPGLARVIVRMSNPYVLGAITIGASLLVTWAFWPRDGGSGDKEPPAGGGRASGDSGEGLIRREGAGLGEASTSDEGAILGKGPVRGERAIPGPWSPPGHVPPRHAVESPRSGPRRAGRSAVDSAPGPRGHRRPRRAGLVVTVLIALALVVGGLAALAVTLPAAAAQPQTVRGRYLTLVSVPDPRMATMGPGETVHWQVGISVDAPDPGTVDIGLSATGNASMGLTAAATACSVAWVDGVCAGRSWPLPALDPLPIDGAEHALLTMPSGEERWVLLAVTMPATARPSPGAGVSALVHASGHGDSLAVGPGGLAGTGGPSARWPLLLAVAALAAGLTLTLWARRPNRRHLGDADRTGVRS
ncbi:signal peptidase I [Raineyella sp. LH-20]|uniref:signal peptidase I n=1 Tax=Raineyella sp. LH-20 TaxID=3081204 RepID=UPI0029546519|nr:signal peptidase I [Raineyella sp. LH-20]WOP19809.1 signal peptidase I [Raineyella sp. LH-20]